MEALQQFVINMKINGKEVTPNLNKLISDSFILIMYSIRFQGAILPMRNF
ncbi:hypothetical protein [Acetivibrio straminisolvens]|nr:hypothetical protein [Acetivibrio straminisolvens]